MPTKSVFIALAFTLLILQPLLADKYCVTCSPSSPQGTRPFRCEATTGGEIGRVECGIKNQGCQVTFYDGRVCGPGDCSYNRPEGKQNLKWCVFHEGCNVFDGSNRKPAEDVRSCCFGFQEHNDNALCQVRKIPGQDLSGIIDEIAQEVPNEFQAAVNFSWVCDHERQGARIHELAKNKRFGEIRAIYGAFQAHNPNARNILAAVSDDGLMALVANNCPPTGSLRDEPSHHERVDKPGKPR